jgi:glycerol-3-phosphate dehydrogenase
MRDSVNHQRATALQAFTSDARFDVLVVGGGIVGAGVARDAAMRGLRTALVERADFASGTSSRSSRLLHGGLRYLAQGRLGLVREASVEKLIVTRIAPHLSQPMPFVFPTRSGTVWRPWKLRIGTKAYDALCGLGRNLGKSDWLDREQVLSQLPGLNPDGLSGAVRYFDALTNDARLVIDTIRSAANNGATVLNYAPLMSADRRDDLWRCRIDDTIGKHSIDLTARCVVNATGPWANLFPASKVKLRLTKGVHLVIDRARLPIPSSPTHCAVVMTSGKRVLFAIPWGERVILGTTDTDFAGDVASPTVEPEDVAYILDVTNETFRDAPLTSDDVISSWAGLRALTGARPDAAGMPSDISRRHQVRMSAPGWLDVTGGKLTTYRLMAEQTVDLMARHLDRKLKKCATATTPLLPANDPGLAFSGILPPAVSREAVEHYVRNEWAVSVEDVMVRRTSWRYVHRDQREVASRVSAWMM